MMLWRDLLLDNGVKLQNMGVIDRILGFYEDIREFNSSNIKDFRGRMKSWIKMGMLAGRIFYVKDMWARDVAALTFASFMASEWCCEGICCLKTMKTDS